MTHWLSRQTLSCPSYYIVFYNQFTAPPTVFRNRIKDFCMNKQYTFTVIGETALETNFSVIHGLTVQVP